MSRRLKMYNLKDMVMKKILVFATMLFVSAAIAKADDRPVTLSQLPAPAQSFISQNFPSDKLSYATKDDDIILPDYNVVLVSGVRLTFANNGALEKITVGRDNMIPEGVVPVQITEYVKTNYPDATIMEYEIDRRNYEVRLSNRLELKFNKNFALIGIDD